MKLLFDQNLSPRLAEALAGLYPGSIHVRDARLHAEDDDTVWAHAARHGFAIASKDADFHQRSFVFGHPPKVVWIRRGNCSTVEMKASCARTTPSSWPSRRTPRERSWHWAD